MSGEGFFAYQESTVAHGEEGFNKVVLRTKALLPSCTWYISPLVLSVPVANSSSRSSLLHLARKKEFPSSSSSSSSRRLLQRSPLCVFIGRRRGERRNTNKKAKKEHAGKAERRRIESRPYPLFQAHGDHQSNIPFAVGIRPLVSPSGGGERGERFLS